MAIKAVFFDIGDTLVSGRNWLPGARDLLRKLRERAIRIGLISNTGDLSRERLAGLLPEDFEFAWFNEEMLLLSSEVGVEKPALSIFMMATSHSGCSPWETLFVGESLAETYAAQAAGMRSIRICKTPDDLDTIEKLIVDG